MQPTSPWPYTAGIFQLGVIPRKNWRSSRAIATCFVRTSPARKTFVRRFLRFSRIAISFEESLYPTSKGYSSVSAELDALANKSGF